MKELVGRVTIVKMFDAYEYMCLSYCTLNLFTDLQNVCLQYNVASLTDKLSCCLVAIPAFCEV